MAVPYTHGWHEVGPQTYAYLVPNGSWCLTNAGLVVSDGRALLVDTLMTLDRTARMLAELEALLPGVVIETVVNTHAHCDHCWGNQLLPDATVISSQATRDELPDEIDPATFQALQTKARAGELGTLGAWLTSAFGQFDVSGVQIRPADRTFSGELEVRVGRRTVLLRELGPAHLRGDTVVVAADADTAFVGDLIFTSGHPILWKGTVDDNIRAARQLRELGVSQFVPGHGPIGERAHVDRFVNYLRQVADDVEAAYKAGASLAEAARSVDVHEYTDWSDPERVAITASSIYRSLGDPQPLTQLYQLQAAADLAAHLAARDD